MSSTRIMAVKLILVITLSTQANAHSWMTKPRPYARRVKETFDCIGTQCSNACPDFRRMSSVVTPESPAETWKRGQNVNFTWARNNHHGGFVAFSLVPSHHIHNRSVHAKLTLFHKCWETGLHPCLPNADCGTDLYGHAFSSSFTIPPVFPDGLYVLRYVWYGGLHFEQKVGQFPDFISCSFVRIEGGGRTRGIFRPFFEPGNGDNELRGNCRTSATAIGQCGNQGCPETPAVFAQPEVFETGGLPPITPQLVENLMGDPEEDDKTRHPSMLSVEPSHVQGICAGRVCCALSCGACGGVGCHLRPGGSRHCCTGTIQASGRRCHRVDAPCVRS